MAGFDIVTLVAGLTGLLLVAGAVRVASDRLRIPYTVALVLVGVVLGEAARRTVPNFDGFAELPMAADIILFVLIPTLVFEAAFHTNGRLLRQNLWLSVGYNWAGFEGDPDLARYEYTQDGFYLRLRFKFDETLFMADPYASDRD